MNPHTTIPCHLEKYHTFLSLSSSLARALITPTLQGLSWGLAYIQEKALYNHEALYKCQLIIMS